MAGNLTQLDVSDLAFLEAACVADKHQRSAAAGAPDLEAACVADKATQFTWLTLAILEAACMADKGALNAKTSSAPGFWWFLTPATILFNQNPKQHLFTACFSLQ